MQPGDIVDRYEIVRSLGEGGMAEVYLARHTVLGSSNALKILDAKLVSDEETRERFLAEGRIQAQLRHPNIVPVTDVVALPGVAGLVMQYIEGPTLEDWLAKRGPLPTHEVRELFLPILAGVAEAHDHGVVHRDLKPANVLLHPKRDGGYRPMIADFGIAKIGVDNRLKHQQRNKTRTQMRMGTLLYMAPEQILDAGTVDLRADIFALGAILYEMATGKPAFDDPSDYGVMNKIVDGTVDELIGLDAIDPRIAACVRRALQRKPAERFPSCQVFAEYLADDAEPKHRTHHSPRSLPAIAAPLLSEADAASLAAAPIHDEPAPEPIVPPPAAEKRPRKKRRSRWPWLVALGLVAGAGALAVGAAAWFYDDIELYWATHVSHTEAELRSSVWPSSYGVRLRFVPSGRVAMGSPPSQAGRDADEVRFDVTVSRPILAMETEVTQAQWQALMGSSPNLTRTRLWDGETGEACDRGGVGPSYPVTCVDWYDAVAFANRLSAAEGLAPAYEINGLSIALDLDAPGYRLPTEAEWQRMAGFQAQGMFGPTGDESALCAIGNVAGRATRAKDRAPYPPVPCDDGFALAAPVGRFQANALGLYDLTGNAWEWVQDAYTASPPAGAHYRDWAGPSEGTQRVLKGGSWYNPSDVLRIANRYSHEPTGRSAVVGFRLVRTFRPADAGNGLAIGR